MATNVVGIAAGNPMSRYRLRREAFDLLLADTPSRSSAPSVWS